MVETISAFISPSRKKSRFLRSSLPIRFSKCENSPVGELGGLYQLTAIKGLELGLRISIHRFSSSSLLPVSLKTYNGPKRKQKQCSCKIWGDKQRVLWYFPKWPIATEFTRKQRNSSSWKGLNTDLSLIMTNPRRDSRLTVRVEYF